MFPLFGTLGLAFLSLATGNRAVRAQTAAATTLAKPPAPDDLTSAELLKSYLQTREQLHAAQLALVNNRIEAEAKARAQAAAVTEKMEAIKAAIEAERESYRAEIQRANADRQRLEMEQTSRTMLWSAAVIGTGALAILVTPRLRSLAAHRIAKPASPRTHAAAPGRTIPAEPHTAPEQVETVSSQRLLSALDQMERRMFKLEHPAAAPAITTTTTINRPRDAASTRRTAAADQAAWIAVLLAKGQALLAAHKAREAVVCFDEILKLDENSTEALVKKGAALERLQQDDAALRCYDRAIELDPKMTLAYLHKGGVCHRMRRYDEAGECYEAARKVEEMELRTAA